MIRLNEIKEAEVEKELRKIKEEYEIQNKLNAEKKEMKSKHNQELNIKFKEREEQRKHLKQEWTKIDKMGIAKWRISNLKDNKENKNRKISP